MSAFKCQKCGKTTAGNENFCEDCGQPFNIKCPECGNGWRFMFDYKFCPNCGHSMKEMMTFIQTSEIQISNSVEQRTSTVFIEEIIEDNKIITGKRSKKP